MWLMANCLASENLSCDLIVIMFIIIPYNYMHYLLTFWIFTPDLCNCYHEAIRSCKAYTLRERPVSYNAQISCACCCCCCCFKNYMHTYLNGTSPGPSHAGSCSLRVPQTQCSSSWCFHWAPEKGWWLLFDSGWRRCPCRPGWCRMGLYHSQ